MLDQLVNRFGTVVPDSAHPLLRGAAPIALATMLFAVIGLAWPLTGSSSPAGSLPSSTLSPDAAAGDGGTDGFLAMARWGRPAYDAEAKRRAAEAAAAAARADAEAKGLNPELAKLGVIGISSAAASHAVLLVRTDGTAERLTDGEALPDGRMLVSVSANALVLEAADGGREELLLFPRVAEAVVVDDSPADEEAGP